MFVFWLGCLWMQSAEHLLFFFEAVRIHSYREVANSQLDKPGFRERSDSRPPAARKFLITVLARKANPISTKSVEDRLAPVK
jgi:hypothetical protein